MKSTVKTLCSVALMALVLCPLLASAQSGSRRERFLQDHGQAQVGRTVDPAALPSGIRIVRDVAYGSDPLQRLDVYAPPNGSHAPVIFMVHGGGWRRGDKTARGVVQNKVIHWVPRGIIVISVDYPLLPHATPLQQAHSVAKALAFAQQHATEWGGDGSKFVMMGHSAGAHLVALIGAEPSLATSQGALPWLGTVALDSAAYDVASIMRGRHPRLYDEAFGNDPAAWTAASPIWQLHARIAPFLAVCSSRRADACPQARGFADKARRFDSRVEVLPEDMRHGEINAQLGMPSDYTTKVDAFLASLGPSLAKRLH